MPVCGGNETCLPVNGSVSVSSCPLTEYVHWKVSCALDGDTLLFEASGSNSAMLYIGKLGLMDSSGDILIADRDQTGTQLTSHAYTVGQPTWAPNGAWYSG
jgi:hypothetical protein